MTEKVETPNTQLQKVTLLVAMHDYEPDDLDAGEWLFNVLLNCVNPTNQISHIGARVFMNSLQVLKVENCEVVVSNGL